MRKQKTQNSFIDQPDVVLPNQTQHMLYDQQKFLDGNIRRINLGYYKNLKQLENQIKNDRQQYNLKSKLQETKYSQRINQLVFLKQKSQDGLLSKRNFIQKSQRKILLQDDLTLTEIMDAITPVNLEQKVQNNSKRQIISEDSFQFTNILSNKQSVEAHVDSQKQLIPLSSKASYMQLQKNKLLQQSLSTTNSVKIVFLDDSDNLIAPILYDVKIEQQQNPIGDNENNLSLQEKVKVSVQKKQILKPSNNSYLEIQEDYLSINNIDLIMESFVSFNYDGKQTDIIRHNKMEQPEHQNYFYIHNSKIQKFKQSFNLEQFNQRIQQFDKVNKIRFGPVQLLIANSLQLLINLDRLQVLYLVRLQYEKQGIMRIAIPKLQHLVIFQCQIFEIQIDYIESIQSLIINNEYALTTYNTIITQIENQLNLCQNLQFLQLSYVSLSSLDLSLLFCLEYLEISHSNIEEIKDLPVTLVQLNLISTQLKQCSPIYSLKSLNSLIIQNNNQMHFNFNRIPQSVLNFNFKSQKQSFLPINFSSSKIRNLELDNIELESFLNMPVSLVTLSVQKNKFINLHQIEKLQLLQSLNLSYNNNINNELWFLPNSLISLNISHCQLDKIADLRFLQNLIDLNISYNTNVQINKFVFPKQLLSLNISYCKILEMPDLSRITNLKELDLSGNCIDVIENINQSVQILSLNHCNLDFVDIMYLRRLQVLKLEGNTIKFFTQNQDIQVSFKQDNNIISQKFGNVPKTLEILLQLSMKNTKDFVQDILFQAEIIKSDIIKGDQ